MVHQKVKDVYSLFAKLSFATYPVHKFRFAGRRGFLLHLGAGRKIIDGFINIDSNVFRANTMWYDMTLPLPFDGDGVEVIYCSNTMEHLYIDDVLSVMRECYRVLAAGGVFRIVVPDMEQAAKAYVKGRDKFFPNSMRKFASIGGRFADFLFCDGQHKYAYDYGLMNELAAKASFKDCARKSYGDTSIDKALYEKIRPFEEEYKDTNLFVELYK